MRQMSLHVGGMGCRQCIREVTARLRDVAGVVTVAADHGRSQVHLGGSMDVRDVLDAFAGTSYRVRVVRNSDETATGQPAP